ncbi:MAG: NAD(P)H-dependent oxidoreductase [Nitrospirae bacterium]|nr:NAD(P)H-dependent oxidoreductase [Nitrospirota bacterium]
MKHLVTYTHPNPKSFNHAIKEAFVEELEGNGQEVRVRDLYEIGFYPVLTASDFEKIQNGTVLDDVKAEQDHIRWAEVITFIHPIWWTGMPALMKGYIDRVFTFGFAYLIDEHGVKGLLQDKKAIIINTTGTDRETYGKIGMLKSLTQTIDDGIYKFCAMEIVDHKYFCAVPYITNEERITMLKEVRNIARSVSGR